MSPNSDFGLALACYSREHKQEEEPRGFIGKETPLVKRAAFLFVFCFWRLVRVVVLEVARLLLMVSADSQEKHYGY